MEQLNKMMAPNLPSDPGIYKFKDENETILYIGKAKNLKKRISSYFGEKKHQANKTRALVKNAHHLDYVIVEAPNHHLRMNKDTSELCNEGYKNGKISYLRCCTGNY